ncbi:hypothetical protein PIB30_070494 [Stylosanthes scabra]|uniref:O-methyltransferase C-terminal domain-containing protein n=1 Tax=Stylosanthes scabra TaxID=79078 RepID=A0ABU6SP68_9FABA|nr:hypothetical protein [Stylosanthes scabra]
MPLSQLIISLQIHPSKTSFIQRLMRILINSGFIATKNNINNDDNEVEYLLTDSSMLLLKNNPLSMTPFVLLSLDPVMIKPWHQLSTWLMKNDCDGDRDRMPFETEHGIILWDYASRVPKLNLLFNDVTARDAQLVSSLLLGDEKWKEVFEGLESLVDVGGGTGTMTMAIAKSFPKMSCVVFDLPHVVAGFQGNDENLKYVGGNMFEAIPPCDAILLKWILHDWNDKECMNILMKCKEAITKKGKKGKVIIIDMVVDDEDNNNKKDDEVETQLFFDMLMMVEVGGKERSKKESIHLTNDATFRHTANSGHPCPEPLK